MWGYFEGFYWVVICYCVLYLDLYSIGINKMKVNLYRVVLIVYYIFFKEVLISYEMDYLCMRYGLGFWKC